MVELAVLEHPRLVRDAEERADRRAARARGRRSGPRSGRCGRRRSGAPPRAPRRSLTDQLGVLVVLVGLLALVCLPRARDRAGVAEQVDEARVGPRLAQAVDDEDVVGRLVGDDRLAAGGELAVQDAVPQQVLGGARVEARAPSSSAPTTSGRSSRRRSAGAARAASGSASGCRAARAAASSPSAACRSRTPAPRRAGRRRAACRRGRASAVGAGFVALLLELVAGRAGERAVERLLPGHAR